MAAPPARARCRSSTGSTARRAPWSTLRSTAQRRAGSTRPQTRALLEAYGIPLVPERIAATADEAVAAAEELGFPVVVKTAAAGAHKTETGGVALDLGGRGSGAARPSSGSAPPVLVQRYLAGGAELLAGVVQDPVFGPLVAFGPGGVFAELIGDAAFRIAPLTDVDAEELVTAARPAGSSPASAAPRRPTRRRSSTSSTGSPGSPRTCPRSPSSTSTRCSPAPTAASRSTRASACGGRPSERPLKSW